MNKVFVTSDLHFGHRNILKFNPRTRPYETVEKMDDALISNWNAVVSPSDDVFNLGDLSFHRNFNVTLEILERLNGRHHLILGNHDRLLRKPRYRLAAENYLESIQDYVELNVNKRKIVMCHYSMRVWNCMHHGAIMLYGHSHGSLTAVGRSMDVGIDSSDMNSYQRPFFLDDVINFLSLKKIAIHDHHTNGDSV